jgi:hypothetical protein
MKIEVTIFMELDKYVPPFVESVGSLTCLEPDESIPQPQTQFL